MSFAATKPERWRPSVRRREFENVTVAPERSSKVLAMNKSEPKARMALIALVLVASRGDVGLADVVHQLRARNPGRYRQS